MVRTYIRTYILGSGNVSINHQHLKPLMCKNQYNVQLFEVAIISHVVQLFEVAIIYHMHHGKTQISQLMDSYFNTITLHVCIMGQRLISMLLLGPPADTLVCSVGHQMLWMARTER